MPPPTRPRGDTLAHVAAAVLDLGRDQCKQPLGVCIACHQTHFLPDPPLQRCQVLDNAVVRKQSPALLKRMGVAQLKPARRGVADVANERRGLHRAGLTCELPIAKGGKRLLIDVRSTIRVEVPETGAIRFPMALGAQRIGRL